MEQKRKHTALPWKADIDAMISGDMNNPEYPSYEANFPLVANLSGQAIYALPHTITDEQLANAEFAARAANEYYTDKAKINELVQALRFYAEGKHFSMPKYDSTRDHYYNECTEYGDRAVDAIIRSADSTWHDESKHITKEIIEKVNSATKTEASHG